MNWHWDFPQRIKCTSSLGECGECNVRMIMRTPEETEKIVAAVRNALLTFPEMRVGQLLINSLSGPEPTSTDPFYVEDAEAIKRLYEYGKLKTKGLGRI